MKKDELIRYCRFEGMKGLSRHKKKDLEKIVNDIKNEKDDLKKKWMKYPMIVKILFL